MVSHQGNARIEKHTKNEHFAMQQKKPRFLGVQFRPTPVGTLSRSTPKLVPEIVEMKTLQLHNVTC